MTVGMPARELATPAVAGAQMMSSSGQTYTMAHAQVAGGGKGAGYRGSLAPGSSAPQTFGGGYATGPAGGGRPMLGGVMPQHGGSGGFGSVM